MQVIGVGRQDVGFAPGQPRLQKFVFRIDPRIDYGDHRQVVRRRRQHSGRCVADRNKPLRGDADRREFFRWRHGANSGESGNGQGGVERLDLDELRPSRHCRLLLADAAFGFTQKGLQLLADQDVNAFVGIREAFQHEGFAGLDPGLDVTQFAKTLTDLQRLVGARQIPPLQQRLGLTVAYVTHDQSEALALSHHIAVMSAGRIQQIGTPREIYERPHNQFVADFVGSTNFIDGQVTAREAEGDYVAVQTELGTLRALTVEPVRPGDRVVLSVRPEDVQLSEAKPATEVNVMHGMVDQKVFIGEAMDWQLKVGQRIVMSRSHPSIRTPIGQPTYAFVDPAKCVAMPAAAELKAAA